MSYHIDHWFKHLPESGCKRVHVMEWEAAVRAIGQKMAEIRELADRMEYLDKLNVANCRQDWSPEEIEKAVKETYGSAPAIIRERQPHIHIPFRKATQ